MKRGPGSVRRAGEPARGAGRLRIACLIGILLGASVAAAQAPRPPGAPSQPLGFATPSREEGVRWQSLTPTQREALAPLERDWSGIEATRKQKWIALAARFKTLSPEERGRITARMSEWTKLTPEERGQARLRFEEARQVPAPDRTARWQAYQALPDDQRTQFAARAASAASGARDAGAARTARAGKDTKDGKLNIVPNPALAQPPKPVAPTLVQAAPGATTTLVTRQPTPPAHQQSGMPKIAATQEFVNRSTLLPKRGPQAAAVATPAPPSRAASAPPR